MIGVLTNALDQVFCMQNEEFNLHCSIGSALYPNEGDTTDSLLAAADKAMYKTKAKEQILSSA